MTSQLSLLETEQDLAEAAVREFYRTPAYIVHQLLDTASAIRLDDGTVINGLPGGMWVDAGAGDGAIWSTCVGQRGDVWARAVEIRGNAIIDAEHCRRPLQGLYIHADWTKFPVDQHREVSGARVVVMNSPFTTTHRFVTAAFELCPDAWVWSLQRQSWGKPVIKDKERRAFVLEHWPEFKLQCMGSRPSFDGKGTDTNEYVWYGWSPSGRDRRYCRYEGPCTER